MSECAGCKFFRFEGNFAEAMGTCHRHAPRGLTSYGDGKHQPDQPIHALWPRVAGDDWCGDFQLAEAAAVQRASLTQETLDKLAQRGAALAQAFLVDRAGQKAGRCPHDLPVFDCAKCINAAFRAPVQAVRPTATRFVRELFPRTVAESFHAKPIDVTEPLPSELERAAIQAWYDAGSPEDDDADASARGGPSPKVPARFREQVLLGLHRENPEQFVKFFGPKNFRKFGEQRLRDGLLRPDRGPVFMVEDDLTAEAAGEPEALLRGFDVLAATQPDEGLRGDGTYARPGARAAKAEPGEGVVKEPLEGIALGRAIAVMR